MWAKLLKSDEKSERAIFVTVEKWMDDQPVQETVGYAVDRQALTAFRERIKKGMVGVIALGGNRDCRVDLTHVKTFEEVLN